MPAVQPPALILVTGATGYIAAWIVRTLLDAGFAVRGTARSQSKANYLNKLFAKEVEAQKFGTVIVEDIARPGAFDEAVKGVNAIAHTASPFHYKADHPDDLIIPAVNGTVGVLESTVKFNPACKRIIILSSCAAVVQSNAGRVLTEEDWNNASVQTTKEKVRDAPQIEQYRASKTLAEKAAWDFYAEHKNKIGWDIVSLNPPFVFGPIINDVPDPSSLGTSASQFYDVLCKPQAGGKTDQDLVVGGASYVDVRDIADAHLKAFLTENAGGERVIVTNGNFTWQELLDVGHAVAPNASSVIHKGKPGAGKQTVHPVVYSNSKSKSLLGVNYRTIEETVRDSLKDFAEKGWWTPA